MSRARSAMRRAALAALVFATCLAVDAVANRSTTGEATAEPSVTPSPSAVVIAADRDAPPPPPPAPGSYQVGTTPIGLRQPTDPQLGITPSDDAARNGMFAPTVDWPIVAIHAALATNGHLVTFGTPVDQAEQEGMTYDDWNPFDGDGAHVDTVSADTYNAFCNSLTRLPDGTFLMVGGNSDMSSMLYDPLTQAETEGPSLQYPRWYNTTIRLSDNRILVIGGDVAYYLTGYQDPTDNSKIGVTPEIWTPGATSWKKLSGARAPKAYGALGNHWWYPRAFVAPDGLVFGVSGDQMWKLDPSGGGKVTLLGTLPASIGVSGSQVMFAPGKILFAGGGQFEDGDSITATNAATVVDINHPAPLARAVAPMHARRNWGDLTVLPTGEVFANGGTIVGRQGGDANSDYRSEIWNPERKAWRWAATARQIRTYHSNAVLLPDGAVWTGGGGVPGPVDNFNAEIYYPPYLFTKANGVTTWADRPEISTIAGSLTYGGNVTLRMTDTRSIGSVSLTTLGSVTHSENTDQRRVPLTFTQKDKTLQVRLRTSPTVLPPGSYLLQVVAANGVPAPAQIVTIEPDQPGTVTVYEPDS